MFSLTKSCSNWKYSDLFLHLKFHPFSICCELGHYCRHIGIDWLLPFLLPFKAKGWKLVMFFNTHNLVTFRIPQFWKHWIIFICMMVKISLKKSLPYFSFAGKGKNNLLIHTSLTRTLKASPKNFNTQHSYNTALNTISLRATDRNISFSSHLF